MTKRMLIDPRNGKVRISKPGVDVDAAADPSGFLFHEVYSKPILVKAFGKTAPWQQAFDPMAANTLLSFAQWPVCFAYEKPVGAAASLEIVGDHYGNWGGYRRPRVIFQGYYNYGSGPASNYVAPTGFSLMIQPAPELVFNGTHFEYYVLDLTYDVNTR